MKKLYFTLLLASIGSLVFSQASDLFISEYVEGSSYNKAMEIFNGTGTTVDLANYRIAQSVNGGGWEYYHTFPSGATIADGDVWVIVADQIDPTLYDPLNADEVLAYPSVVHFNGDDARALERTDDGGTTWYIIDQFGDPDNDPGDGWPVAGVSNATKDHSLIRKETITGGNTDWVASFGTNTTDSEWEVLPQNDFSDLGSHSMITSIDDNFLTDSDISVFPTVVENRLNVSVDGIKNLNISVINIVGVEMFHANVASDRSSYDLSFLANGIYIVRISNQNNEVKSFKVYKR